MAYPPEHFAMFIHRGGRDVRVNVSRELVEDAIGSERVTAETMAEWVQVNFDRLARIAEPRISMLSANEREIVLTPQDAWW